MNTAFSTSSASPDGGATITPNMFARGQRSTLTLSMSTTPQDNTSLGRPSTHPPSPLHGLQLFYTSAKTGEGVRKIVEQLAQCSPQRRTHRPKGHAASNPAPINVDNTCPARRRAGLKKVGPHREEKTLPLTTLLPSSIHAPLTAPLGPVANAMRVQRGLVAHLPPSTTETHEDCAPSSMERPVAGLQHQWIPSTTTMEESCGTQWVKPVSLAPSARDAFSVFEDLCLLANSEKPNFLKLESLHKTFALELIESVLTNSHAPIRQHEELILLLRHHICPLLLKALSDRPLFPLTLRCTRVVFILLKQFIHELDTEAEVFLAFFICIVGEEGGALSEHHPFEFAWVRKNIDTPL
ncbi:hypothetical protein PLEOSDRAFT_1084811 [Pleurotus ostreatus PC15]|uniref:Mon2/Sec7/BIG1-like HUS domain-containing protein n=1 Tax=Pleurotus ostreatus (strain PC15) TaxID=1137138 RepID=A0A067NAS2_PLEO1|nr:hypothetical protein PLEOSDRAFT_1084811 [Pleurotus ostreatus PC15]